MLLRLRYLVWALAIYCAASCGRDEPPTDPAPEPLSAANFEVRFPDAQLCRWQQDGTFDIARFELSAYYRHGSEPSCAWFDRSDGELAFARLQLDFGLLCASAPAVARSWEAAAGVSLRHPHRIEALTYGNRPTLYLLHAAPEPGADADSILVFTHLGELLLRQVRNSGDSEPCPAPILEYLDARFASSTVTRVQSEDRFGIRYYEIELYHSGELKRLRFDANHNFIVCTTELKAHSQLPEPVRNTLLALAPATDEWAALYRYENDANRTVAYALRVRNRITGFDRLHQVDPDGNRIE